MFLTPPNQNGEVRKIISPLDFFHEPEEIEEDILINEFITNEQLEEYNKYSIWHDSDGNLSGEKLSKSLESLTTDDINEFKKDRGIGFEMYALLDSILLERKRGEEDRGRNSE